MCETMKERIEQIEIQELQMLCCCLYELELQIEIQDNKIDEIWKSKMECAMKYEVLN